MRCRHSQHRIAIEDARVTQCGFNARYDVTTIDPWACPTCGQTVSTPFCPTCGERLLLARELTIRGLFDQLAQAFTSIDGRLLRSFRFLVGRPGFLTVAYLQGQRKPYVGPVSLFLM